MNNCTFEVSEEDAFSLVFKFVGELLNSRQEGEQKGSPGDRFLSAFRSLVQKDPETDEVQVPDASVPRLLTLFTEKISDLFENGSDTDIESCIRLVIQHLLNKLTPTDAQQYGQTLASAMAAQRQPRAETRLNCLLHLYNAAVHAEVQYSALMQAMAFAVSANLSHVLAPIIKNKIDAFVANWKLSPAAASKLYLRTAALVRQSKGDKGAHIESITLTSKALASVEAADSSACKEVAGEAAEAIADFLKAQEIFACDLLDLAPVKALAKNPTHVYLHQLFSAVTRGNIQQLEAVCRADLLQSLGITQEHCLKKTRMNALLNLAQASGNKGIPYDTIQSALRIERGEVEEWVVRASGAKLFTARIDQAREVVAITACLTRGFDNHDWKQLKEQLASWHTLLREVQQTMKETVPAAGRHDVLPV